jgi:hypothetical protein
MFRSAPSARRACTWLTRREVSDLGNIFSTKEEEKTIQLAKNKQKTAN